MKVLLLLVAASVFAPAVAGQSIRIDASRLRAYTDQLIGKWLLSQEVPGATFAFVADGRVVFTAGYGLADIDRQVQVDPERALFRVASLSKPVTATAIAMLVQDGKLAYDDVIDDYVPGLATRTHEFGPITLHHLLTHTAGYDERNIGRMVRTLAEVPPLEAYLVEFQPRRVYAPGEIASYSNYGFYVLGRIVEVVSGLPFAEFVQDRIFGPLAMDRSSFAPDPILAADFALGYNRVGAARVSIQHGWDIGAAASSLSTTAADFSRFMLAHLGRGSVTLQSRSFDDMHAQHFTHHERLAGVCYGWFESNRRGWRRLVHDGHWIGFSSRVEIVPELGLGAFLSMNAEWAGWPARAILTELFDEILPVQNPSQDAAVARRGAIDDGHAHELAGEYRSTVRARRNIESITSLLGCSTVEAIDAGRIRYQWAEFVEVEPYLFLPAELQEFGVYPEPIAFQRAADGTLRLLSGRNSSERVPWYDTSLWQSIWLASCLLVAAVGFLLWPIAGMRRYFGGAVVSRTHRTIGLLGFVLLILGGGLALAVDYASGSNGGQFAFGVPWWAVVLLSLPLVGVGLTLWLIADATRAFVHRQGSLVFRSWLLTAAVGNLGLLVWLWHWNLLGFRF